nr:CDP-alcohol phosphatidyltransferase family protein [Candidatus Prometheoarchaeum syntrophicum]QEE16001.1 Bifunctional IPC transferase and DIPP synthase [Candidatus Prometheoarchaeum syntrophicum]
MTSKFRLRPIFAPLIKFLAKGFVKLRITPNIATLIMLFFSIISSLSLILLNNLLLFGVFIFITGIMDGIDGAIARLSNKNSKFGAFFDSSMDRLSEGIIFLAIVWKSSELFNNIPKLAIFFTWFCLVFSFLISYVRVKTEVVVSSEENKFDSNIGLFARSERLFYLVILSILSYFLGTSELVFFSWGIMVFSILIFGTFLYRFDKYRQFLIKKK